MTDAYLRSLGFAPLREETRASRPAFKRAWNYQYNYLAETGTVLFLEYLFGINRCRLSATTASLRSQAVFADLPLQERPVLEAAIGAFFRANSGMGALALCVDLAQFHLYRRQR